MKSGLYKWKNYILLIFISIYFFVAGCGPKIKLNTSIYFNQRQDSLAATIAPNYEVPIQPGDRLTISVTALDPVSVAPFNINVSSTTNLNTTEKGYLVENDGYIKFPQLGKITAKGYTISRLTDTLTSRISKFVNDPLVIVQFINFKVVVLGEVNRPGIFPILEGRSTLLEMLGQAGDLTNYGRRDNIMIVREKNGKREFGAVNLLSINAFNSPYYNLQQNDIVYVEANKNKPTVTDQSLLRNISLVTGLVSLVVSLFFLVINLTK